MSARTRSVQPPRPAPRRKRQPWTLHRATMTALRVPPVRWTVALAVALWRLVRATPRVVAASSASLTPRQLSPVEIRRIEKAHAKRARRNLRDVGLVARGGMLAGPALAARMQEVEKAHRALLRRNEEMTPDERLSAVRRLRAAQSRVVAPMVGQVAA